MTPHAPHIDWAGLSPVIALTVGPIVVLMAGLFRREVVRRAVVPVLTVVALGAALGLSVWQWGEDKSIVSGALAVDDLSMFLNVLFCVGAIAAVVLALRDSSAEEAGHGEWHALLLSAVLGMVVLAGAENLVVVFLGLELLSIPLYVMCATNLRRSTSLESGLKYLIVGSVGSATLLYGLALIYGAAGTTSFGGIAAALGRDGGLASDPLTLTGIGLLVAGLCFKVSAAPFHQWTPDVYEGAPTPVTAFMAVATKAAAFGAFVRLFDVALVDAATNWAPLLAVVATVSIVVGNVGALGQSSLKRLMAWSSVAQAGYMLAGVVVADEAGVRALVFYLAVYLVMNIAAFAVIVARERETAFGDDIRSVAGLGASRPELAWPMTLAMLSLAGMPATAGFVGKFTLISASVQNDYAWLGIAIVIGSMISLAYYLRVIAAMWLTDAPAVAPRPVMAGGSPELDSTGDDSSAGDSSAREPGPPANGSGEGEPGAASLGRQPEVVAVAVAFGAATLVLGIVPSPLLHAARDAGRALGLL
ncbi:MAG: NADH-quinone oxidoreductase subunit [Solirubrobacteraceae bacterium]|jgi:NADH-quinone oxidoreductase subunit N|nr:NADH-quinone oxidoreductase subunit [Solirubrobacteraceae bacterium]